MFAATKSASLPGSVTPSSTSCSSEPRYGAMSITRANWAYTERFSASTFASSTGFSVKVRYAAVSQRSPSTISTSWARSMPWSMTRIVPSPSFSMRTMVPRVPTS